VPASYRNLGPTRLLTATPDATNRNKGNWTIVVDPQTLNCKIAQAEVHQISIDGPIGSSMSVYINQQAWNQVVQGWANNYDPVNPLYVRPGDTLFLFWRAPLIWKPVPTATLWLRYDTELPENKYPGGAG
jgi:hypothetical protein